MNNYQHKIFLLATLFACLEMILLFPKQANADTTSISVSPALIQIEAKPPADVWTPFTVENDSNQSISLKIGYKAFDAQASSNGNVVFLNDGQNIQGADKKIFGKMQIVDDENISRDSIDIGPKQQLRFRLRITLPDNEPSSDYYFSLIFLQAPSNDNQNGTNNNVEEQKSFSSVQAGVGINVLLAVGDKEAPFGSIDNFSAPWFLSSGPVLFTLSVHNSGTHFISPHGKIMIKNIFGQTVGKISIPSSIILSGTTRNFVSSINQITASTAISSPFNPSTLQQKLIWPETFLLGPYTAYLTLTLSNEGPVYVRTIHFFSVPLTLFIEILVTVLLIVFIYLRVKKKLR
jgi:hypothetical protein